jgi:hypothetical protein
VRCAASPPGATAAQGTASRSAPDSWNRAAARRRPASVSARAWHLPRARKRHAKHLGIEAWAPLPPV